MDAVGEKKIHDFHESIKRGDAGEAIVIDYFKSTKNVRKVVNMSNNKLFYHKDVDIVVELNNGQKFMVEIKTDSYKSGNIYYETKSNVEHDVDGCMKKTAAHYLAYYFSEYDKLYILDMEKYSLLMSILIERGNPYLTRKEVYNKNKQRNGTYTSIGYTFPLSELEKMMKADLRIVCDVKKNLENQKNW